MAKVFIDLGVMDGRSIRFFREFHPEASEFRIVGFECLPANLARLGDPDYTLIRAAAWKEDGTVRFHTGKLDGSSVYGTKKTGNIHPNRHIAVPCVDFADFLQSHFSRDDTLLLKMNIEGAEYDLIDHLHARGMIDWIDIWYVQWHWDKIGMDKAEHDRIKALIPQSYPWHPYGPGSVEAFRASLC